MTIRHLDPLVVNQIAAGEVVERPASVAKELIENAIDAGATRITVVIEQGGCELLSVTDDGLGISADELVLAVAPHATSKIEDVADLDTIATMGFRGEALASIASVSRLTLRSRPRGADAATEIVCEGATQTGPRPAAGPPGTSVVVRNLFFNTPARRRFLKTPRTEGMRVRETIEQLALAQPSIAFVLESDGRRRIDLPAEAEPRRRVERVLGEELAGELLEIDGATPDDTVRVWGLAGTPDVARGTSRHQRVFLNGRPIVDRSIAHAIKEAYRGLVDPTRHPTAVVFIEMDPALVDVNVHPAKAEVRFRDQGLVHGVVHGAVRAALRGADLTPAFAVPAGAGRATTAAMAAPAAPPPAFGRGMSGAGGGGAARHATGSGPAGFDYRVMQEVLEAPSAEAAAVPETLPTVRMLTDVLHLHSSYLVTEDEDGLLIIDQHALHERVMFEKLRQRIESGTLESQRLLMPATVPVSAVEIEALESMEPMLERLGIDAELMGPTTIGVHGFTSLLFARGVDPVDFMQDLLRRATEEGLPGDPEAALHEVLDMMACKAAIKAGDRLPPAEIEALLAARTEVERASNCPHGRPTTLRLSIRDLERQFGR